MRVRGVDLLDEAQKISFPALAIDIDKQRESLGVCERAEAGVGVCFVCELSILDQATLKSFERNDESKEFEPHRGFRYSNTKKSALQPLRASTDHQLFRRVSCPASSRDEKSGTIRASKIGLPTIKSDETWRSPCLWLRSACLSECSRLLNCAVALHAGEMVEQQLDFFESFQVLKLLVGFVAP